MLLRQLVDQKDSRREQHRREVYIACLDALSTMVALTNRFGALRVAGSDQGVEGLRDEIATHLAVQLHQMSALQLVGPDKVVDEFARAHRALMDFAEYLDRLPPAGSPARPSDLYRAALPYLEKIGEGVEDFGRAARASLELG